MMRTMLMSTEKTRYSLQYCLYDASDYNNRFVKFDCTKKHYFTKKNKYELEYAGNAALHKFRLSGVGQSKGKCRPRRTQEMFYGN